MKYDIVITGGGIVGLASAYSLLQQNPRLKVAVVEKEPAVAMHQTGHNSGVIHSGLYYKPGSLKAQNCLTGYRMLIDFCNAHGIAYELCGKVVVATSQAELPQLDMLFERGKANGLDRNYMIGAEELKEHEPHADGIRAIVVPYTGIIDYVAVAEKIAELVRAAGGEIHLSEKVTNLVYRPGGAEVITDRRTFETALAVNCAGLHSDRVARYHYGQLDTRIIPFRGEYYMLKPEKRHLVKNLIYPVPDPDFPFLGVHFTRMIDGGVEAGPNAVFAFAREAYEKEQVNVMDMFGSLAWPGFRKVAARYWKTGMGEFYRSFSKPAFTKALQRLIPAIREDDLVPAEAGVRAQACDRTGGLIDDFKIIEDAHAIHILNAPSPAATSSLSIGHTIAQRALNRQ